MGRTHKSVSKGNLSDNDTSQFTLVQFEGTAMDIAINNKSVTKTGRKPRVFVSWIDQSNFFGQGGVTVRKQLSDGSYLVGNSSFATIRIGGAGLDICARLLVARQETRLQCISLQPTIYVEGRKLNVGESVIVGDVLEVAIGRVLVRLMASEVVECSGQDNPPQDQSNSKQNHSIDALCAKLSRKLLEELNLGSVEIGDLESHSVRETVRLKLRRMVAESDYSFDSVDQRATIEQRIFDEIMGLGPLEPLLADSNVSEIMVNSRQHIYVERNGRLESTLVGFSSDQALLNVIERIASTVGRRIDTSSPIVDARLLDGSRVNAVIPPISLNGPTLTIRRFSKKPITIEKLLELGSLSDELVSFLELVVSSKKNVVVSGGTGSGKTTLLNALSSMIPSDERIITIEDAAELQLQQPHVVRLEARPANIEGAGAISIRNLVKNTLRMRPDRIIVGECRGGETLDMLQAMNTGHDGSLTTAHANSPHDLLRRLETMTLMADVELPLVAIREQIASAVCLIIQQSRLVNGRRVVTHVSWLKSLSRETGGYEVRNLFFRNKRCELDKNEEVVKEFFQLEGVGGVV